MSDQFSPFATSIPATANEAPFILDGLLMTETGKRIREQYADTGGLSDIVFAVTALLAYRFIPSILTRRPGVLRLRAGQCSKVAERMDRAARFARMSSPATGRRPCNVATMLSGTIRPSHLLRKFASYPRQHELAVAIREIGRVERTLFIIEWLLDTDMQRRARIGLNKGEAHHALKNALRIGRQGEIRDRTTEGQHYRMAGLNLLVAIIIYWNTGQLAHAVAQRERELLPCPPGLLAHTSPLGWANILITGEYRWPRR
ncbi:MAG: Tn3 family transposase [Geminicoccaceae bacterium]